jgi:hypothetical protein
MRVLRMQANTSSTHWAQTLTQVLTHILIGVYAHILQRGQNPFKDLTFTWGFMLANTSFM